MSESDYLTSLKARWLILHNDVLCRLNVAENFVATIASQKLPSELPPGTAPDFIGGYAEMVRLAREAAQLMKDMESTPPRSPQHGEMKP